MIPLGYLQLKRKCLLTGMFNSGVLNLGSITPGGPLLDFRGSMKPQHCRNLVYVFLCMFC